MLNSVRFVIVFAFSFFTIVLCCLIFSTSSIFLWFSPLPSHQFSACHSPWYTLSAALSLSSRFLLLFFLAAPYSPNEVAHDVKEEDIPGPHCHLYCQSSATPWEQLQLVSNWNSPTIFITLHICCLSESLYAANHFGDSHQERCWWIS